MAHLDGFEAESYLKSGSNELRVLEYNVCGMSFGINILKVKKIVSHMNQFLSIPESHPAVRGVFEDRGLVIPLIDLAYFLGIPRDEDKPPEKVIITEFFEIQNGLWVDKINWIHHFGWEDVIDAQGVMHGFDQKYVIGIVKPSDDHMILLLDYENIILDICPQLRNEADKRFRQSDISGDGRRVLVVEDSPAIRNMLVSEFSEVGFDVSFARDGKEGLDVFETAETPFDLVISDVEMPRMDGLALTVAIRGGKRKDTPIIVYSSIGDVGMKARAELVQADAHITKLNFDDLLVEVDKLLANNCDEVEITSETEFEAEELTDTTVDDILAESTEFAETSEEKSEEPEPVTGEPASDVTDEIPDSVESAVDVVLTEKPVVDKPKKAKAKTKKSTASKAKAKTAPWKKKADMTKAKASVKSSTKKTTTAKAKATKKAKPKTKTVTKKKAEKAKAKSTAKKTTAKAKAVPKKKPVRARKKPSKKTEAVA